MAARRQPVSAGQKAAALANAECMPSRYRVVGETRAGSPLPQPPAPVTVTVTVRRSRTTTVNLAYDSGIR